MYILPIDTLIFLIEISFPYLLYYLHNFHFLHLLSLFHVCLISVAMVSAMFEKCCVLFNIGILQGQVAKVQNLDSDEGLKSAAKYFQVSPQIPTDAYIQ